MVLKLYFESIYNYRIDKNTRKRKPYLPRHCWLWIWMECSARQVWKSAGGQTGRWWGLAHCGQEATATVRALINVSNVPYYKETMRNIYIPVSRNIYILSSCLFQALNRYYCAIDPRTDSTMCCSVNSVHVCVADLLVTWAGLLLWLENRSTAALWLLAWLAGWVAGDTEGVCMLISFRRWSYTHRVTTILSPYFSDKQQQNNNKASLYAEPTSKWCAADRLRERI